MASVPMRSGGYQRVAAMLLMFGILSLVLFGCGAAGSAQSPSTAKPLVDEPVRTATYEVAQRDNSVEFKGRPAISDDVSVDDGLIDERSALSPFEDDHPAIANLEPGLRSAVQQAASDAAAEGIKVLITSGWRSERYQQLLLDEAVTNYGSLEEARKWVSTPELSAHVTGEAVDIGATDAAYWISEFGSLYGLCQTYANEIWHFERTIEPGGTCPEPFTDASAT